MIVLCVAAGMLGYGVAGGFHSKRPTLVSYFDVNSPNWRGASLGDGVVCWKLLDTAKVPHWSADYCSVSTP